MKKIIFLLCMFSFALPLMAAEDDDYDDETVIVADLSQIDIPTASTLEKYGFMFNSRLYSEGGTQMSIGFGLHDRLMLGASFLFDGFIGNGSRVSMRDPEIQVKFRFFDGADKKMPALALGYDGQGFFYDDNVKEYQEERRGLYLVGTYELLKAFFVNAGVNISDFDNNHLFGFAGANYTLDKAITLMAEYDNLFHHSSSYERLNAGVRLHITTSFSLDVAVRGITNNGRYKSGLKRESERVMQLHYSAMF